MLIVVIQIPFNDISSDYVVAIASGCVITNVISFIFAGNFNNS
jgi:hypothetical protein